jgi:hypothetical protein
MKETPTNPHPNADDQLKDLGTHAAGAVNLFKNRKTAETTIIEPPKVPNPGPYDTRTGDYE